MRSEVGDKNIPYQAARSMVAAWCAGLNFSAQSKMCSGA